MCSTHWASMHGRNDIHWTARQHTLAHIGALIRYPRNELSGNRCSTYVHIIVYIVTGNTSTNYFVLFFGLYTHVSPAMWDRMEHGLYVPCQNYTWCHSIWINYWICANKQIRWKRIYISVLYAFMEWMNYSIYFIYIYIYILFIQCWGPLLIHHYSVSCRLRSI